MARIGIVGSGNVGANAAFFAAEKDIAPVVMHDIREGLSTGKALDMMEAAPVRGYQYPVSGTDDIRDLLDSDVVIISVGAVRESEMTCDDLYKENREVIATVASALRDYEGVVVVVTEPVDRNVMLVLKHSGLPWQRVLGLGGTVDSMRLRYFVSRELQVEMGGVAATVIGAHSNRMIPLLRYTNVSGVPVTSLLSEERIAALFDQTRRAGNELLGSLQQYNSRYGPAAAAVHVAEAVVRDSHRILPVSFMLSGQYGVSGVAMSLPAVIGKQGVVRVLEPSLTANEMDLFTETASQLAACGEE